MIPIKQTIQRRGTGFTAREWREKIKAAWQHTGEFHHRVILKKKFRYGAEQEYGFKRRSAGYLRRKSRKYGHTLPLVFSGNLMRSVTRIVDVRASSKGASVILHGPRYLYQYRRNLNQPNKAAELRAISQRDARLLAQVLDRQLQREIDRSDRSGRIVDIKKA